LPLSMTYSNEQPCRHSSPGRISPVKSASVKFPVTDLLGQYVARNVFTAQIRNH
jgi:hypothetical protein